jgi:hypothetical protein
MATPIDILIDDNRLRSFVARLSAETGCSELVILKAVAILLAQEEDRRADNLPEVLQLRRVQHAVACAVDRLIRPEHPRHEALHPSSEARIA